MQDKKIYKTEEEWKNKLTPEEYAILRDKGTERPFSGKYLNMKEEGMFTCKACGNQLFSSDTKFDSDTGWPSFDKALPGAVEYVPDNSGHMSRTEVVCAKCGSHLGHVFDDGPRKKGGKRYCINSVCLEFEKERSKRDG